MNKVWKRLEKLLFYILVFLLPTQLAYHFWPTSAFVFGIRVDYLSPTLYLTDLLIFILLTPFIIKNLRLIKAVLHKHRFVAFLFILLILTNVVTSGFFIPTIYKWLKFIEFCLFAFYISVKGNAYKIESLIRVIFYSVITFSLLGITQFIKGETVGQIFYLIGERTFDVNTPGIALVSMFGKDFIRAYSTFSHPNSFAGYLMVSLILFFGILFPKLKKEKVFIVIPALALLLTFSLSSVISLVAVLLIYALSFRINLKKLVQVVLFGTVLISIIFPVITQTFSNIGLMESLSVSQRLGLFTIAGKLIGSNYLLGVGLNKFIPVGFANISSIEGSMFLQPVHNFYLLLLSEVGMFGLIIFCFLLYKLLIHLIRQKQLVLLFCFLSIMISGLFDHYWFTLQQNILLIFFLVGIAYSGKKSSFT